MNRRTCITLDDYRLAAKRSLPRIAFDFIDGGVNDETSIDRNRDVFLRHCLVPRFLVDVSVRSQQVRIFGREYATPFGVSPMGIAGFFRPGADLMFARAARTANAPYVMSSASNDSIEAAMQTAPETTWFQIYGTKDPAITDDLVRRAKSAKVPVIMLTVDTIVAAGRERNTRNGFTRPIKLTPSIVLQGLARPAWTLRYLKHGGLPMMENWAPYLPGGSANAVADLYGHQTPAPGQTWDTFKRVRDAWDGPLMIKGILHPDDARMAVEIGADGIVVSNHGGRQFDRGPSPLEMLPAIRKAVGDGIVIAYDSGIRRGGDIAIAKCLGADFALAGRPFMFAAAAEGETGIERVFKIMATEIDHVLAQIGCPDFRHLGQDNLSAATDR